MVTQVIKRDLTEQEFNKNKIYNAILKAMKSAGIIKPKIAQDIADEIEEELKNCDSEIAVSDIEYMVYDKLISKKQRMVARIYEDYRAVREYQRETVGSIDEKIFEIIHGTDENIKDNSNKNPALVSTMRDLVAEEVSKDIALRYLLPPDIVSAHQEGILYIHDLGHYLNPSFNCELVNLEDMFQNGTVINGKMITKPHTFRTACTIATQIIAQVASGQFGGQTMTLTHLAPFVRDSYNRYIEKYIKRNLSKEEAKKFALEDLKEEIRDGIQTFQYQINTLQTSNGQAPFLSVLMYISEDEEYEKETAMLIEEMLNQRIKGMQNKVGAWISPAFPKLLYVTDENNIYEDSEYFYITKLAAKCIANRMMPDCLSAKKLKEYYEGNVVPPMG